ncbi:MAG: hypothetical protein HBSAPP02_03220 [Phycisphaerae bacterium]|nr:MAG: hypothetical protein HRU71_03290 [Planctomycetia bacterium]RIK69846.1 MAG: hypothetical protein DCC66_07275 [Planctomycetota bacterium]GJQ25290.1 MAG: hypothetical protein HBSAPP02_03220 [Phycisphaerae bacterium]
MAQRRFILIDHSIRGFGGHHYEYAVHVLAAARDAGFETILAVNRAFTADSGHVEPWKIVPVYEHGFWRNIASPPKHAIHKDGWRRRYFEWKLRFKHGKYGQMLAMIPLYRQYYTPRTIQAEAKSKLQLVFMLLGLLLIKWPYNVLASTVYLLRVILDPFEEYLKRIGAAIWHLIQMIFYPVRIVRHLNLFERIAKRSSTASEFSRDTADLFRRIGFQKGDVVFIPTLSDHDLSSLQSFLASEPAAHQASWHLLFRRDLLTTDDRKAGATLPSNPSAVQTFQRFHQAANGTDVRFYTDTDRLTHEYNAMGTSRFRTLPIPINPRLTEQLNRHGAARPLRIVYCGDARMEKGYHLLPDLVRDLHRNGHADDVVFRIQSNFAHARPQDGTIEHLARTELQLYPARRVEVIPTPLNSEQYHELVASADILLVLYDADNYYARSSGVLVEALAAGIPVLTPAASWMGQQIAEATYDYLSDRIRQSKLVAREQLGNATPGGMTIKKPWDATGVFIRLRPPTDESPQVILDIEQRRSGATRVVASSMLHRVAGRADCLALFRLDAASDEIQLRLTTADRQTELPMRGLELAFTSDSPESLHGDAAGRTYLPGESISDHLKHLVEHYEHYRDTAQSFARIWNARHSAARLVQELVS